MNQDVLELLKAAREEIIQLRRANEVLAAKVEVMDLFAKVLRASVPQDSLVMKPDLAWDIQGVVNRLASGLGTVEGIRAIMGRDVPMLLDGMKHDISWIKRLRDKAGCGLKEAKDAMEMMVEHLNRESGDE